MIMVWCSIFKCGVIRYRRCKSASKTRPDFYLVSSRSSKIIIDSSGEMELAKAALPKGVGKIFYSSIVMKCLLCRYAITFLANSRMQFAH